ncbi:hypothetical protein UFOVP520_6 [uncultured Caudovirales phage]|uniref:Uncharacterized protein n=1 Tax=uncultured Caudovirales phage TaxID=2100421 RepID=A0A6J5MR41_9CAUD|nr:hypothetical protein UFOVP520_6 [uncultured Caudovirales phage]
MTNKLTILFILFAIVSCKTSKVESQKSIIKIDTFRTEKIVHIYNSVKDTLIIENPCDSSGILTRFYSKITIPQGKIIIRSYKGSIKATIDIDSIKNVYEKQYQSKLKENEHITFERIVKEVIPTWAILTMLIQGLLISVWVYFKFIY